MPCKESMPLEHEIPLSTSSSSLEIDFLRDAHVPTERQRNRGERVGDSSVRSCENETTAGTLVLVDPKIPNAFKSSRSFAVVIANPLHQLIMELVPVKIEWSEVFGRYLVATRDIRQSELIFQVEPIVAGPTPSYTEKEWICMSCFRATKKKTMIRCSDCQWPFCCRDCEEVKTEYLSHSSLISKSNFLCLRLFQDEVHRELECLILAKAKVLPEDSYSDHITLMQLLRTLLVKHKDPEGWQQILSMESHVDGRKHSTSEVWERWRQEEIKFIHDTLDLREFTEEEINFVSGVLSMNAFGSNDIHGVRHR